MMEMKGTLHTAAEWKEALWRKAEPIYVQSFPEHGRKPEAVVRRMFERRMCRLFTLEEDHGTVAMALAGRDEPTGMLVIDYLAVSREARGRGAGLRFMERLKAWAEAEGCRGILVEVEAEPTEENLGRIRFWERCGLHLTDYVHTYIWVPEPYRAMYLYFSPEGPEETDGQVLFEAITRFHERAYRGRA